MTIRKNCAGCKHYRFLATSVMYGRRTLFTSDCPLNDCTVWPDDICDSFVERDDDVYSYRGHDDDDK